MKKIFPFICTLVLLISCSIDDDLPTTSSSKPEYIFIPKEVEIEVIYKSDYYTSIGAPVHGNLNGLNYQIINSQSEWDQIYNSIISIGNIHPVFSPQTIDFDQNIVIFLSAEWDCTSCEVWIDNVVEYKDYIEIKIDGQYVGGTFFSGDQNIYFAKIPKTDKPIYVIE